VPNSIQILLIEDNPGDVRLIQEYLKDSGLPEYQLHHGETLAAGRKILYQQSIQIVLLDLHVPDSMGFSTFEKLYEEFPDYPFVVLTGLSDATLGIRAVKKGAQDFLNKNDLNGQILGHTIRYAIQRQQLLRRLEQAQRMAKIGNWELNLHTNELICSRMVYDIFEKGPGFEFRTLEDYLQSVHPDDQAQVALRFRDSFLKKTMIQATHRLLTADQKTKYVNLRGELTNDPGTGKPILLMGTIQDITESKQVEELKKEKELATKAAKLRQDFLARTSHEIRTPLNPILLLTGMLLKTDLDHAQRDQLNTIKNAGETLLAVVNDILDLAKIEAGKIDFNRHNFSLRQVFDSIKEMMDINAREKGLELVVSVNPDVPDNIIGDTVRLTQILLNLIGNAIKFTHKGYVRVSVKLKQLVNQTVTLEFSVKDTGIGIPQDKLKEIFESFKQLDIDANRRYGGTGLGLTIVQQLVKLQGGDISVESHVDVGSTFTFQLQFEVSRTSTRHPDEDMALDKSRVKGLEILLVEDNPLNQLVTKKLLTDWGIVLDIANNGREAIERLEKREYNMVFMDLQMPEMDGVEATEYIRNKMDEPTRDVPIVALTANAFTGTDDRCLQVGMNDYVSKPIQMKNLYAKIVQHARPQSFSNNTPPQEVKPKATPQHINGQAAASASETLVAPPPPQPVKVINLDYLKEISGGDAMIISKTIEKFLETTPEILDQMDRHLLHEEHTELGRAAHKLKSSVAFMGIDAIKETILEIESITKNKTELSKLPAHVGRVRQVLEQAYGELREALDSL
jgi:signal transduction histidine kinase/HPt (histidine-containing phosphotransfer) domain-containing protein